MHYKLNKGMMKLVYRLLWLTALCGCTIRTAHAQEMPQDPLYLEGGPLFDITWLSRDKMKSTDPVPPGSSKEDTVLVDVLPNQLLGKDDGKGESLVITSANQERYTCVLPDTSGNELINGGLADTPTELRPESLLQALQHWCTKLLMGYWTYELCHGDYLRQYHEEKLQDGKVKIDEYFLGEFSDDIMDTELTTSEQKDEETTDKIPIWPYGGRDYPYYSVVIGGGTPCDIKDNQRRSVLIRYICDLQAYKYGTLLRVDEATTCKYEALVSTPQLCQNHAYQLKENPSHTISCYAEGDSPRRPKALLEQELMMSSFKAKADQATPTKSSTSSKRADEEFPEDTQEWRPTLGGHKQSTVFELDTQFMRSFLNGEMCLRGGGGWWLHEVCYGQHVKQLHVEADGDKTEVYLGYWIEPDHKAWYTKTGIRKRSKTQVVHLYKGGDICDVIGTPRQCQVKYKCLKTSKASQISLYLEEPTTCNYMLTVEGAFVCNLLQHLDDYGIFDKQSFEEEFASGKEESPEEVLEASKKEFKVDRENVLEASKKEFKVDREDVAGDSETMSSTSETKRPGATPRETDREHKLRDSLDDDLDKEDTDTSDNDKQRS